jgi:hypothetical protein
LEAAPPLTVRSQLKPVFDKMVINREQDLVRILTSLSGLDTPRA